jgi:Sigma-70 region 2
MTGLAWGALCLLGIFLFAALGDLVSEEVRGWLDLAPRAILRLAAAQLDPELRERMYQDEWLPELIYVLRGAESRPITRLIQGSTFALGLLISARRIAHQLAETGEAGSLLDAAAGGDQKAWNALVDRYAPAVWRTLRLFGLSSDDMSDVSQIVWLRLAENLDRFEDPDHLATWLETTAKREALRAR